MCQSSPETVDASEGCGRPAALQKAAHASVECGPPYQWPSNQCRTQGLARLTNITLAGLTRVHSVFPGQLGFGVPPPGQSAAWWIKDTEIAENRRCYADLWPRKYRGRMDLKRAVSLNKLLWRQIKS